MTISILHIVVPTILVLAILILYMNSRNRRVIDEIGELKTQLEQMENTPAPAAPVKAPAFAEQTAEELIEKEEQDVTEVQTVQQPEASAYNTGKSGKIYTKEELELLIKE